jgi:hypothetical protein
MNACKPGKEHRDGDIVKQMETDQSLIRDYIDDYCRKMVVGVLMTMTVIDGWIFSINFIRTFRCSVLLLN